MCVLGGAEKCVSRCQKRPKKRYPTAHPPAEAAPPPQNSVNHSKAERENEPRECQDQRLAWQASSG
jgi:hypothetical protein